MKTLDRSSVAIMLKNFAFLAEVQHNYSEAASAVSEELRSAANGVQSGSSALDSGIESYAFARCYMLFCRLYVRKDVHHWEADRQLFLWSHQLQISTQGICFKHIPLDAYRALLWTLDMLSEDVVWRQLFDSSICAMEV